MKSPNKNLLSPFKALKYLVKKPVTIEIPKVEREAADRYRGFHTNDWETCIGCGTCADICPTDAIRMDKVPGLEIEQGKTDERPVIDYGRCCWCAFCVDICPSGSLKMTRDYTYIDEDPNNFIYVADENGFGDERHIEGYQRNEDTDLLDLERVPMIHEEAGFRRGSFVEYVRGFSWEEAMREASRCVECGICTNTCPAHLDIPGYIRTIWDNDMEEGIRLVYESNPLPGVCGRVCTHKCEEVCAIAHRGDPISIRWLKRYIVDNAPDEMYRETVMSAVSKAGSGNVAIVGSGPSGLSAAYYLRTLGYEVTVYEALPLAGGVMRYGIPRYRLPEEALDRDLAFLTEAGVKILTNTPVGKKMTLEKLGKEYDAVYISTGFMKARSLSIPGSDNPGVFNAMEFLPAVRDYERGTAEMPAIAESIVVIGGGNVAFDAARSAVRLQMKKYGRVDIKVTALESMDELPADLDEIEEGRDEGLRIIPSRSPVEIVTEDGKIKGVKTAACLSVFDEEGRFAPVTDENDMLLIEGEQVFVSIGQSPDYSYIPESIRERLAFKGNRLETDDKGRTSIEWLFAGGDIVRGPDIITAIADGHNAAKGIDELLNKE